MRIILACMPNNSVRAANILEISPRALTHIALVNAAWNLDAGFLKWNNPPAGRRTLVFSHLAGWQNRINQVAIWLV